jgi:cation/acetate symporter
VSALPPPTRLTLFARMSRFYGYFTLLLVLFFMVIALLEWLGVPNKPLGYALLFATLLIYAGIGFMAKTSNVIDYYVAGRRIPALFNGMAVAADWMSAASFIGLAGTLYHAGFEGLAYILGWTGGYCLVAICLAPYLRRFGAYTIPDFLGARYGGRMPRLMGVFATVLCSLVYLVAQIYGVGLIASRFTGLEFTIGVFVGLAGILVCSFLGGMKAVTWTQVAQCIILLLAYLIPVAWLSAKQTDNPVAQVAAYTYTLPRLSALEIELNDSSSVKGRAEADVRAIFAQRAQLFESRLQALAQGDAEYLASERANVMLRVNRLRTADPVDLRAIESAERELRQFPQDVAAARASWARLKQDNLQKAESIKPHAAVFPETDPTLRAIAKRNFIALVICLMLGTAALPHILTRFYTTPTVRAARESVFWSMFFILLLYVTAPALAILVKFDIYQNLVGSSFAQLPAWVSNWQAVDKALLSVQDINLDGIVQLAEIGLSGDVVMLAMPEIGGLPYVITGLVAAGGLAAALSTADGLLLAIGNALAHDVYFKTLAPMASPTRRLVVAKVVLLVIAVVAAYLASLRSLGILTLVGAAFSLSAAALFPTLICGIFWPRANRMGVLLGMSLGLLVTLSYMIATHETFGIFMPLWWDIKPIAAGIFGVPLGFIGIVVGSLLSAPPAPDEADVSDWVRFPASPESQCWQDGD